MKNLVFRCLVAFVAIGLCSNLSAAIPMPQPPALEATTWYLVDARTGFVLTEKDANRRVPPASLTKMMTTYVADHALKDGRIRMGDMVLVSEKAWRMEGSRMFIQVGTRVSVEDLVRGVIIQSGNDASVALAEHIAGSEESFASLMNQYAERAGMKDSHFRNATGLPDPEHYTTAHDLALLARAIIFDFPEHYRYYAEKDFTYNSITQPNRNLLLWRDPTVDGLKTGHTQEAGYCLVASAERSGTRLISVVMGTASEQLRATESAKLINWGYSAFETYKPYTAGTVLGESVVWMGVAEKVAIGTGEDVVMTLPRGVQPQLQAAITIQPELRAPLRKGDRVGALVIRHGEQVVLEKPLVAMANVEEANIFRRMWHWLRLFFGGLFG